MEALTFCKFEETAVLPYLNFARNYTQLIAHQHVRSPEGKFSYLLQ